MSDLKENIANFQNKTKTDEEVFLLYSEGTGIITTQALDKVFKREKPWWENTEIATG